MCRSCRQSVKGFTTFWYFEEDLISFFGLLWIGGGNSQGLCFYKCKHADTWKYAYWGHILLPPSWNIQTRHRKAGTWNMIHHDSISEFRVSSSRRLRFSGAYSQKADGGTQGTNGQKQEEMAMESAPFEDVRWDNSISQKIWYIHAYTIHIHMLMYLKNVYCINIFATYLRIEIWIYIYTSIYIYIKTFFHSFTYPPKSNPTFFFKNFKPKPQPKDIPFCQPESFWRPQKLAKV